MAERLNDPVYTARVTEILDRLDAVEPKLRRSRTDRYLARFRNTMAVIALVAFVLAGLAIAKANTVGRASTAEAKRQAVASKHIADCINRALGLRAAVGQRDPVINKVLRRPGDALVTDSDATRAVFRALNEAQAKPPTLATRALFFDVSLHAQLVLDANQADRAAHPIGVC